MTRMAVLETGVVLQLMHSSACGAAARMVLRSFSSSARCLAGTFGR